MRESITRSSPTLDDMLVAIRERIRPVCPNMPDSDFDQLTRRMAEIEYKYAQAAIPKPKYPTDAERRKRQNASTEAGSDVGRRAKGH